MTHTAPSGIPLVDHAARFDHRTALVDNARSVTYAELLDESAQAAATLLAGAADLDGERVAFLTDPSIDYVLAQWGTWRAGGIAVPLCVKHPAPELAHVLEDSGASIVVCQPAYEPLLAPLAAERGARLVSTTELREPTAHGPSALPSLRPDRGAMLIYTSGTTGKPKGALTTHAILEAQIRSVVEAWEWSERDRILHVLPLHHLHGILNLLCAALWSGAVCELMPRFDASRVWKRICDAEELTLFMAVPTIYAQLIAYWDASDASRREAMSAGCRRLRLMVSGSAALPVPVLDRWRNISGHTLLERYGMTEIGMGLGNPLHGERRPGHVGTPFPGVEVRLVDAEGRPVADGSPGEIQVRGPNVFAGYWGRPDATAAVFTDDGWFRTGDVAVLERDGYRILGRESVDILKTGGYKVSALEIEAVLREHEAIAECAVVGVPDPTWGQRVAAAVVVAPGASLELEALRAWGKQRLAAYKVPTLLRVVDDLPRNPMGKVVKPEVTALFTAEGSAH